MIFFGDDEPVARELVLHALEAKGYEVRTIDTSRSEEMAEQIKNLISQYGPPEIFIMDGHNILKDESGNVLFDMTPIGLMTWLKAMGITSNCKFILYSNDFIMVEQARQNSQLDFYAALPKSGREGGITQLVRTIESALQVIKY